MRSITKSFLFIFPLLFLSKGFADSTHNGSVTSGPQSRATDELEKKIYCAFEKNGMSHGPTKQAERAKYVSKHLAELFVRMADPQWREPATQHLLAQVVAETGNLKHLTELASEHKSSQMLYKGRGTMQTTHKDNYARLAGCAREIESTPPPSRITWDDISEASPLYSSHLVSNPDAAMSEASDKGKFYNVMSSACFFIDTAVRHPKFAKSLNCRSDNCIDEIGVGVNKGPGKLGQGDKPLSAEARRKAFRKMDQCFRGGRGSFIGV